MILTLPAHSVSESCIKIKINFNIFIVTLLCGASKGFMKAFKAFIKPFEAPLHPGSGLESLMVHIKRIPEFITQTLSPHSYELS